MLELPSTAIILGFSQGECGCNGASLESSSASPNPVEHPPRRPRVRFRGNGLLVVAGELVEELSGRLELVAQGHVVVRVPPTGYLLS